ncbi:MAG: glutathione S-transferase [Myxococcaceae bacterium]|nr:glutathione S-transferase [Myxococcaceae bacterium]
MNLKLYQHPLAGFCHKVLIALYENDTPFESCLVDLGNEASRSAFLEVWPIGKFPVLRVEDRALTIPESTIIIEYLAQYHPGSTDLLPRDPERARETRLQDRFYDQYVSAPMQTIVGDHLRPPGQNDSYGVKHAKGVLQTAYGMIERAMATRTWATGDAFSMADCAAAPALFFADFAEPLGDGHPHAKAYRERLMQRPSFARVLREAEPYMHLFPLRGKG